MAFQWIFFSLRQLILMLSSPDKIRAEKLYAEKTASAPIPAVSPDAGPQLTTLLPSHPASAQKIDHENNEGHHKQ